MNTSHGSRKNDGIDAEVSDEASPLALQSVEPTPRSWRLHLLPPRRDQHRIQPAVSEFASLIPGLWGALLQQQGLHKAYQDCQRPRTLPRCCSIQELIAVWASKEIVRRLYSAIFLRSATSWGSMIQLERGLPVGMLVSHRSTNSIPGCRTSEPWVV